MASPGTMFHAAPFHCSMTSLRFLPLWSVANPTAKQFDDDVQLTLCRIAPTTPAPVGVGLGTMDQDDPFQFSISVPVGLLFPLSLRSAPTAQQSDPPTQEMSNSPPPSLAGSGGCAPSVQAVPFQVSTSGENVPLELMFSMVIPTPQHWVALAQVDPRRTSSAPVPGVVATYQPEDVAPAPTWVMTPTAPIVIASSEPTRASRAAVRCRAVRE